MATPILDKIANLLGQILAAIQGQSIPGVSTDFSTPSYGVNTKHLWGSAPPVHLGEATQSDRPIHIHLHQDGRETAKAILPHLQRASKISASQVRGGQSGQILGLT